MYSKNQKNFLNFLLKYKKSEINLSFSEVFYEYILQFYKGFIIEFDSDNINFYKLRSCKNKLNHDEIKIFQEEIISILYLVYELHNKKYLIFYGDTKSIKNLYLNLITEDNFLFEVQLDFLKNIEEDILKSYIVSSELKELATRDFNSIEQQNLNFTRYALIVSIAVSAVSLGATIFGFYWQWHIATKVNTVIEFAKPEQLQNASSTTTININNDNCKPN